MRKATSSPLIILLATTMLGGTVTVLDAHADDYGYRPAKSEYKQSDSAYEQRRTARKRVNEAPMRTGEHELKPVRITLPKNTPAASHTLAAPEHLVPKNTLALPTTPPAAAHVEVYSAPQTAQPLKIDPALLAPAAAAPVAQEVAEPTPAPQPVSVHEAPVSTEKLKIPADLIAPTAPAPVQGTVTPTPALTRAAKEEPRKPPAVFLDMALKDANAQASAPEAAVAATTPQEQGQAAAPVIPEMEPVAVFKAPKSIEKLKIDPTLLAPEPATPTVVAAAPEVAAVEEKNDKKTAEAKAPATIPTQETATPPTQAVSETPDATQKPDGASSGVNVSAVPVATDATRANEVPEDEEPLITPPPPLSAETKNILNKLPKGMGTPAREPNKKPVKMDRARVAADALGAPSVKTHKDMGISIELKSPSLTANELLEKAYDALIAGQTLDAIQLYQQVLQMDPENKLALFGLATTYHKERQFDLARPLWQAARDRPL